MDFLKDSKNTPIVIGLLIIGIGGAVFSFVHFVQGSERPAPPQPVMKVLSGGQPSPGAYQVPSGGN